MGGGEGRDEDEKPEYSRRVLVVGGTAAVLGLAVGAAMRWLGGSAPETPEGTKSVESIRRGVVESSADATGAAEKDAPNLAVEDNPAQNPEQNPAQSPAELAAEAKEVNPAKVAEIEAKIRAVKTYLSDFRSKKNPDGTPTAQTKSAAFAILAAARSTPTAQKDLNPSEMNGGLTIFDKAAEGRYIGQLLFSVDYYGENHDRPTVQLHKGHGIEDETARFDEKGALAMHRQKSKPGNGKSRQEFVFYDRGSYGIYHLKTNDVDTLKSTEYEILVDKKGKPFMAREIKNGTMDQVYFVDKVAREAYRRGDFNNANWGPGKGTDHWQIAQDLWNAEFAADQKRRREAKVEDEVRDREGVDRVVDKGKVEQTAREILQHPTFLDKLKIEFNGDRLTAESKQQIREVLVRALNCEPRDISILDNMPWVDRKKEKYIDIMLKGHPAATIQFDKETGKLEIEIGGYQADEKKPYSERLTRDAAGDLESHVQERWQNGETVQFKRDKKRLALRTFSGDRKSVVDGKEVGYEDEKATYALTKDRSGKMTFVFSSEKGPSIYIFNVLKGGFESPY